MKLIQIDAERIELPIKVLLSMEALFTEFERFAKDTTHPFYASSRLLLEEANKFPELRTGIEDISQIHTYEEILTLLFQPLFPDLLQANEIKAVMVPFDFTAFMPTRRLKTILENAGDDYELTLSGFDDDKRYLFAASIILASYYKHPLITVSRPIYLDIPNQKTGQMRHYRLMINADYIEVLKTDKAPELTEADIEELIAHGEDVALWKEKFPPESYIVKGFGIMNLFDNTQDVIISKIRSLFLRSDPNVFSDFQKCMKDLFNSQDLRIGGSAYDPQKNYTIQTPIDGSFIREKNEEVDYRTIFSEDVSVGVIEKLNTLVISNMDLYEPQYLEHPFYQRLIASGIKGILLVPVKIQEGYVQVLEIGSVHKNELNALSSTLLDELIPFLKIATERYIEEEQNITESTIQENYTSIHPTVKWKFVEAANHFISEQVQGIETSILEDIAFEKVFPLYGQSDIKGSSNARNSAIQSDLTLQLSLVLETFQGIIKLQDWPIHKKIIFRLNRYLDNVKLGLNAGDEEGILAFLKNDVYPIFNHIKTLRPEVETLVEKYFNEIDPTLKVIYRERKAYEDSVTMLNQKLAAFLDNGQAEAQKMFPHFFERYKTDGVEYNIYIGQSLVNDRSFSKVHLQNLRLWQLEMMCDMEQVAYDLVTEMPYPLRVASLILVHSNPLSIRFRMDEKQFDVDGAYNIRYEIVKKRIDKSYIKGTRERLTQPGKIAIIYSHENDKQEYLNYIEFLQSQNYITDKVELVDLENLQGLSGLKAIRIEVIYKGEKALPKKAKRKARSGVT